MARMSPDKIKEVTRKYRSLLHHMPPGEGPFDTAPTPREACSHVRGMLDQIDKFADAGDQDSLEKAFRWLGFIQGTFWLAGTYTLNQMRDHNRPTESS